MSRGLYIFVTSDRPDQYLNPILHCLQKETIDKVVFVYVENGPDEDDNAGISAEEMRERVRGLLNKLAEEGKYKYFTGKRKGEEVDLPYSTTEVEKYKGSYSTLKNRKVPWLTEEVDYYNLKNYLSEVHKKEPKSIFDISPAGKEYIGDIIAIGVIEGISTIYSFKLARSANFDFPWESLFHKLEYKKRIDNGYSYVNITKRPIYVKCGEIIYARRPRQVLSLLLAIGLVIALTLASLIFGPTNWLIVIVGSLATVASIFSAVFIFIPWKK